MAYTSRSESVRALVTRATRDGLTAAAQVYVNGVKRELRGGYTTGDHVTGNVLNSVTRTELGPAAGTYETNTGQREPTPTASAEVAADGFVIRVGTNLDYALFWEVGWSPRRDHDVAGLAGGALAAPSFRVPIWLPQLLAQRTAMGQAFARVARRTIREAVGR